MPYREAKLTPPEREPFQWPRVPWFQIGWGLLGLVMWPLAFLLSVICLGIYFPILFMLSDNSDIDREMIRSLGSKGVSLLVFPYTMVKRSEEWK